MSNIYAKEYEDFLITGNEDTLKTLIPGSIEQRYAQLCRKIIKEDYSKKLQEELDKFLEDYGTSNSMRLESLVLIKKFKKNPKDKEQIVDALKKMFDISQVVPYQKPVKYNTDKVSNDEMHYPSKLEEGKYSTLEEILDLIYKGKISPDNKYCNETFQNIDKIILDIAKLPHALIRNCFFDKEYKNFFDIVKRNFILMPIDAFKKTMHSLITEVLKQDVKIIKQFQSVVQSILNLFSNEQIEHILTYRKDDVFNMDFLLYELIRRKFASAAKTTEEKKNKLVEINKLLDNMKLQSNFLKREVLISILDYEAQLNHYDLKLFMEYIECPIYYNINRYKLSNEVQEQVKKNRQQRFNVSSDIQYKTDSDEQKIIEDYLFHFFFFDNTPISTFNPFFNAKFLNKIFFRAQILKGREEKTPDEINSEELSELMQGSQLKICNFNKENFSINEDVELTLDIKNINTLYVKIYEINTENYYYTNKKALDKDITVEGLVPTYDCVYSFDEKPQILSRKKLILEKIPKQRGMYIIEFIGNGLASRAIIKKGSLNLIYKSTKDGQVFYILDEENNICKGAEGNETGIWMNDQWFKAIDTGAILIPYQKENSRPFLIFKHNNFCEYQYVNIERENYTMDGMWIVKEESLIMGNLCKCLVRPFLYVNNQKIDISNLKKPKITVQLIKRENKQEIPITHNFDNISLNDGKEFQFEFQVPPRLISLNFILSGEVNAKSLQDKVELSISHEYEIVRNDDANQMLKIINDEYIVELLGKNGEPQKHSQVNVSLYSHNLRLRIYNDIMLETDNEGKINLGKLKGFSSFSVNSTLYKTNSQEISYYPNMKYLKGEEIKLPIKGSDCVYLVKIVNNIPVENLSHKMRIEHTDIEKKHAYVIINDLAPGNYSLLVGKEVINVEVIEGKLWKKGDFIITKEQIEENTASKAPISVEKVEYKDKILKIKISKPTTNSPRVHVTAYQYYDNRINNREDIENAFINEYKKMSIYAMNSNVNGKIFPQSQWKNVYLNNKIIHEEIQYVLDRKQYEKVLGNPLEKPSLLVKPQFIRDTNTDIAKPKEGRGFEGEEKCEDRGAIFGASNSKMTTGGGYRENTFTAYNFISHTPLTLTNLYPTEKGDISVGCDLSNYSTLEIICVDDHSVYQEIVSLNNKVTEKNDLRMKTSLNSEKDYCELRKVNHLSKGRNQLITDITSVKFQIFDSVEKYSTYLKLMVNQNTLETFKKFEFLINFEQLSIKEKLEKVSEFFCHELNIYLYFHQNAFFNEYIYPLIKFKSEKSFIDYFLLNDMNEINKFTDPTRMSELNIFEQCLLIYAIRKTNSPLAKAIAKRIKIEAEQRYKNPEETKRRFNTALNIKLESEKERSNQIDQIIEEKAQLMEDSEEQCDLSMKKCKMAKPKIMAKKMRGGAMMCNKMAVADTCLFAMPPQDSLIANAKNNLFKEGGKSKEYCETHYYNTPYKNMYSTNYVRSDEFYADLATFWSENVECLRNKGFYTEHFLIRPENFPQMIFALSVIDLEAKTLPSSISFNKDNGLGMTIGATVNAYVLTSEISETKFKDSNKNDLIIAQMINNYDKMTQEATDEKEPTKFFVNTPYIQKTIITNISNKNLLVELLMQIPEGALPITSDEYTVIENVNLKKFQSQIFTQIFYFPQEGKFIQYPSSASINDFVVSKSNPKTYEVLNAPSLSKEETKTFDDVLELGDKNEILEFIKKTDIIKEKDLEKVYWLLTNKDFYQKIVPILKEKLYYDETIWHFSIYHNDIDTLKEYINKKATTTYLKSKMHQIGPEFESFFLSINKTNNAHFKNHKDYFPILNNRAHKLPKTENTILTVEFRNTYHDYISYLMTLSELNDVHYMRLCYYLILQQRIDEAQIVYEKIKMKNVTDKSSMQLQYDYLTAYLDFSTGYPKFTKAREICKKYKDFPLSTWNDMFTELSDQLKEFDGEAKFDNMDELIENKGTAKANELKAKSEEYLNISIKEKKINVLYKNISKIDVKFYLINVEILFSRSPFMKSGTMNDFGYVIPNKKFSYNVELKEAESSLDIEIPKEYENKNIYIEVSSNKIKKFDTYYSSLLQCSLSESIGEVKVLSPTLQPLPKIYVKCFCKLEDDSIKFYKDGYTDLRGRFNYVALNSDLINKVKKFSILIISEEFGAIIKECNAPKVITEKAKDNQNFGGYETFQNYRQKVKTNWKASKNI